MSKHTPRPWKARLHDAPQWLITTKGDEFGCICTTIMGNDEANARLIAAAPNLLEACKKAITCASLPDHVKDVIRDAIAESTGATP